MFKAIDTVFGLTKAGFKPLATAKPRHFAAMGRLLLAISNEIDVRLNSCLQGQIASGEEATTRIVVGEMRTGDVMAGIKRIANARPVDITVRRDMEALFSEIANLRQIRDIVAHRTCMVSGNRLAFHNALLAKVDAAIEVSIFSVGELNGFSDYAKRLGYRIIRLSGLLVPDCQSPARQAFLVASVHQMIQAALIEFVKSGKLKGERAAKMKIINKAAYDAIRAYTDSARCIDVNYADLQKRAAKALSELSAFFMSVDAPDDASLREIPLRLRKKERIRQPKVSQSRKRLSHESKA